MSGDEPRKATSVSPSMTGIARRRLGGPPTDTAAEPHDRLPMSSLHLIRSLRRALADLRDAGEGDDADRVARALIDELATLLGETTSRGFDRGHRPLTVAAENPRRSLALRTHAVPGNAALLIGGVHWGSRQVGLAGRA